MKPHFFHQLLLLSLIFSAFFVTACSKNSNTDNNGQPENTWDIDKDGIPRFVDTNYIQLSKIYRISKFRSSVGHDYSDAFEHCRSMKHYFEPQINADWSEIKIFSPVTGVINKIENEWAGTKLEIVPDEYPAFRLSLFHIKTNMQYRPGDKVTAGQQLGTHIGEQTISDIAVMVNDPTLQRRLISYFDVLTDTLFIQYYNRGVSSREEMMISKALRDANPLTCNSETFISSDTLENWVVLN